MPTLSDADQLKGIAYAHELLEQTLGLSNRRDTFYPAALHRGHEHPQRATRRPQP